MSVLLQASSQPFNSESGGTTFQNMQKCSCCPYGYHIDLDFIRYCESFARLKPSDGQMLRRDKRRSRKSIEYMLGLDNLFDHWDPNETVEPLPEIESEPNSPRDITSTNIGKLHNESSTNFSPEPSAFLCDALNDVVNDFERTLERAKTTKKDKRNGYSWEDYIDIIDSCVAGNSKQRTSTPKTDGKCSPIPPPPPPRRGMASNGHERLKKENSSEALVNIRQQMAMSLKRMKVLEEEVKSIPNLQSQVIGLQDEKRQLQRLLQQKEDELRSISIKLSPSQSPVTVRHTSSSPVQFTPQRVSPVSLENLSSKLRTGAQSPDLQRKLKRDVGTMYSQHTKDMCVGSNDKITRSIGTNPINTNGVWDTLYSKLEIDEIIELAIDEYEEQRIALRKRNLVSVGTQMIPAEKVRVLNMGIQTLDFSIQKPKTTSLGVQTVIRTEKTNMGVQTQAETPVHKISIGIGVSPNVRHMNTSCRPETRTVGSSDHNITDSLCESCLNAKPEKTTANISLKLLGEPLKLESNKILKTIGTQYNTEVFHVGTQSYHAVASVGIQNVPLSHSEFSQCSVETSSRQTETKDLIKLRSILSNTDAIKPTDVSHISTNTELIKTKDSSMNTLALAKLRDSGSNTDLVEFKETKEVKSSSSNTETVSMKDLGVNTQALPKTRNTGSNTDLLKLETSDQVDTKVATINSSSNTDQIRTSDHGVNTYSPDLKHMSSNTELVRKRDIACGEIVKPHISIACADNYCDSCKDAIRNLAKEFTKVPVSPVLGKDSRIPRALPSPKSPRKPFMRQNTYTLTPSPTPSPVRESRTLVSEKSSISLDSAPINRKASIFPTAAKPGQESGNDRMSKSFTEEIERKLSEGSKPIVAKEEICQRTSWVKELSPHTTSTMPPDELTEGETSPEIQEEPTIIAETKEEPSPEINRPVPPMVLNRIATATSLPRVKASPSKEMTAALKVINDSLQKSSTNSSNLKSANAIVQKEWFRISSTDTANPLDVEDYLDCFEDISNSLIKYVVNLIDSNGNSAMHYAVSHGNFDVVSILLDSKVCNVNQMNNAGYTCVMLVSLAKLKNSAHRTVVQRLFQMADVNLRAKKHCQTALMLAVSHGNLDMVDMLLAAGADINIQDEDGSTALMCAAEHGRIDIVKHLLSQGDCDSLIQDVDNSTAFKIAWHAGHRDIGLLLYVHEQMLRSKMPSSSSGNSNKSMSPTSPKYHKRQPST